MRQINILFLSICILLCSCKDSFQNKAYFVAEDLYIDYKGKIVDHNDNDSTINYNSDSQIKEQLKSEYNFAYISDFANNYAYATKQIQDDFYIPLYENGKKIEGAQEWVSGKKGGIINRKGDIIISFMLDEYTEVSDDVVKCKIRYFPENKESYSLYGYKDLKDNWIIPPKYVYADNFRFGYAEVSDDLQNYYLINKAGKIVLDNHYSFIYVLSNNKLIVSYNNHDFYLSTIDGKILSESFVLIKIIDGNMCLAKDKDDKFYVNRNGKFLYFNDYTQKD